MEISFLCAMVSKSTMDYKSELKRVLKFQKKEKNDNIIMGADNISQLCIWVDHTYGVHPNMKSHTSDGMSFGYRIIHFKSKKYIEYEKFNWIQTSC